MRNKAKARLRARVEGEALLADIAIAWRLREEAEAAVKTDPVAAAKLIETYARLEIVQEAAKEGKALRFPVRSKSARTGWRRGPCR